MKADKTKAQAMGAAIEDLAVKAAHVADLAKTQRASADAQRESSDKLHYEAHKLEVLGDALKMDVAKIRRELK